MSDGGAVARGGQGPPPASWADAVAGADAAARARLGMIGIRRRDAERCLAGALCDEVDLLERVQALDPTGVATAIRAGLVDARVLAMVAFEVG